MGLGVLLTMQVCAQDKQKLLGEWIEFRREERTGFVYDAVGRKLEPSIEISFFDNGHGTFVNTQIPAEIEPKMTLEYNIARDSLLVFGKVYEIVKLQGDSLVLIRREDSRYASEDDFKMYFLRKEQYNKLTASERESLAAPGNKDVEYLKTIKPSKKDE
jgi:hypothetical protein